MIAPPASAEFPVRLHLSRIAEEYRLEIAPPLTSLEELPLRLQPISVSDELSSLKSAPPPNRPELLMKTQSVAVVLEPSSSEMAPPLQPAMFPSKVHDSIRIDEFLLKIAAPRCEVALPTNWQRISDGDESRFQSAPPSPVPVAPKNSQSTNSGAPPRFSIPEVCPFRPNRQSLTDTEESMIERAVPSNAPAFPMNVE